MSNTITPMMAQFLEIKARHQDALLFYRMGDFYEMFFDDAVAAADALDISLTKRGKHEGEDIPMCGVPVHSSESYLLSLIRQGFRVAVCEQLENPAEAKKRGAKSVVKRDVVRLVTPGTLTEEALLDAKANNYLTAYSEIRDDGALAWVDISTGELRVTECPNENLLSNLSRLNPSELLISDPNKAELDDFVTEDIVPVTTLGPSSFDSGSSEKRLLEHFGVQSLDGFDNFSRSQISALGAILDYLIATQKGQLPLLLPPSKEVASNVMQIDATTRKSLELVSSLGGSRAGSLLASIDRTVTAAGARLLEQRLTSPLVNSATLNDRLKRLEEFVDDDSTRAEIRKELRAVSDIQRALSRLSLGRGGPRDLGSLRNTMRQAQVIRDALGGAISVAWSERLETDERLYDLLEAALVSEPPLQTRDGDFVASGFRDDLDETRQLRDDGRKFIASLETGYVEKTSINALKIKHNKVLGYFIETPAGHAAKMLAPPLSETFIHRQTTANAIRFTTIELSDLETKILNASDQVSQIESEVFEHLREAVLGQAKDLGALATNLAELDVTTSLADLSVQRNWSRPKLDDSKAFNIRAGRHPVVEEALGQQTGESFIANDCNLFADEQSQIWLLTGPNMAGKSTFLRQNAIITILAQMGSYVPADAAHIGIVSQLFSRVGASDDLARGRSTFMVEMVETAAILNQADDRALVILDEIGRGTATYDGLSIAWATLEHLNSVNKCRGLFATHYHELTALAEKLDGLKNATVVVKEWDGDIIFMHEVRRGAADRSYGVQVAKLAGLPAAVTDRAGKILAQLEHGQDTQGRQNLVDDLPLFSAKPAPKPQVSVLESQMRDVNPDDLSPRDALQLLYDLKRLAGGGG